MSEGKHRILIVKGPKGNTGWSFEDVLPYFKKSVQTHLNPLPANEDMHGFSGELHISSPRTTYKTLDCFIEAAGQCGYETHTNYNGLSQPVQLFSTGPERWPQTFKLIKLSSPLSATKKFETFAKGAGT